MWRSEWVDITAHEIPHPLGELPRSGKVVLTDGEVEMLYLEFVNLPAQENILKLDEFITITPDTILLLFEKPVQIKYVDENGVEKDRIFDKIRFELVRRNER